MKFASNPQPTAQAGAVLLRLNGGDLDKYLFIKMLYLADQRTIEKWAEPITGDLAADIPYA